MNLEFGKPIIKESRLCHFCREILLRFLHREFAHFQIFLNTHLGFKHFANFFALLNSLVQGLFKMFNLLQFAQFFWLFFGLKTRFCNRYFDFSKFPKFLQIEEEPEGFPKTYQMLLQYVLQ